MPQAKICKIRRTEKSDVKEVYSTKQTQSQAGPETPHRCLKSGWESASEAWPLQLIGDKAAKALDLAEGAAMQARERHRPHPRASPASPQHHIGDSAHLNHGRLTICTLSGYARYGHGMLTRSIAIARR